MSKMRGEVMRLPTKRKREKPQKLNVFKAFGGVSVHNEAN